MSLADTYITVRVNHSRQVAGRARNVLRFRLDGFHFGPLQHGLHDRSEAILFTIAPHLRDVLVKPLVLLERGTLQARVLTISADDREIVMLHGRAALSQVFREAP